MTHEVLHRCRHVHAKLAQVSPTNELTFDRTRREEHLQTLIGDVLRVRLRNEEVGWACGAANWDELTFSALSASRT